MGRGTGGYIGCTQPRRIAATSVAARVAQELDSELGTVVGYKVRFNDRIRKDSYIKFMTDGILLAELQGDALLRGYDTIIIDEAHERSLNIDFLLGYLQRLLPKRPELRVIVSSATMATERFSEFFGGAPVVEVSGRTYPVEVLYRPPRDDEADLASQRNCALGTFGFREFAGFADIIRGAGNDQLAGTIQIREGHAGLGADFARRRFVQTNHCGHAAFGHVARFLHEPAPLPHHPQTILEAQCPRRCERGEFAQGQTGRCFELEGRHTFF
jgi:HrpA-like RNA helicase